MRMGVAGPARVLAMTVAVLALMAPAELVEAQAAPRSDIPPTGVIHSGPPTARSAREAAGQPVDPAPPDEREIPFQPTISAEEYRRAKARGPEDRTPGPPETPAASPPVLIGDFAGISEADSGRIRPPDTHGAHGAGQFPAVSPEQAEQP